ncbi:hypothetical protein BDF20DRAFT_557479 [Mycotypha africana]|uniref:uncharacterized protein n=1 Tax=Mycotypha africana TaxID=64632 RepID=UPI00230106B4|nr:uncharacterized protein BDF20DRAFT_557479 [Mycotypha africana]KAI8977286.1 hypothetical protein BDF20DRAFT_557479 [Mycotypha africana]
MATIDSLFRKKKGALAAADANYTTSAVTGPCLLAKKPITPTVTLPKQQKRSSTKKVCSNSKENNTSITDYFLPAVRELQKMENVADEEEMTIPKIRPTQLIYFEQFEQIMNEFINDDFYDVDQNDDSTSTSFSGTVMVKRKRSYSNDSNDTTKKRAIAELSAIFRSSLRLNSYTNNNIQSMPSPVNQSVMNATIPRAFITEVADETETNETQEYPHQPSNV